MTALSGADAANYTYASVVGNYTVNKANLTLDGATNTVTYTGSNQTNTGATASINNGQSSQISTSTFNTGLGNDSFTISGYGAGTNVGTYGDNLSLTAAGNTLASNYNITYTNGAITIGQLQSVTYIGPSGGNWSEASNWASGAIPTLDNVGTVIIPSGKTVVYDAANLSGLTPTSAIIDNGTLSFTSALPTTFANNISGTGSIIQSGTGTLTLTGANTYTGSTIISAGTLIIGGSGSLGAGAGISSYAGAVSIAKGASLIYASSTNQIFSGVVSGTDLIRVSGTGVLTLTGKNNTTSNPSTGPTGSFYNESSNIPTITTITTYVYQFAPLPTTTGVSFLTINISDQFSSSETTDTSPETADTSSETIDDLLLTDEIN